VAYTGLDIRLKRAVFERDEYRCRWCGRTNTGLDAHHIEYRRGYVHDRLDNLVSLCRLHHDFVHGARSGTGLTITKAEAQGVLTWVIAHPGSVGSARWRSARARDI
jgi:hypothetical protein